MSFKMTAYERSIFFRKLALVTVKNKVYEYIQYLEYTENMLFVQTEFINDTYHNMSERN